MLLKVFVGLVYFLIIPVFVSANSFGTSVEFSSNSAGANNYKGDTEAFFPSPTLDDPTTEVQTTSVISTDTNSPMGSSNTTTQSPTPNDHPTATPTCGPTSPTVQPTPLPTTQTTVPTSLPTMILSTQPTPLPTSTQSALSPTSLSTDPTPKPSPNPTIRPSVQPTPDNQPIPAPLQTSKHFSTLFIVIVTIGGVTILGGVTVLSSTFATWCNKNLTSTSLKDPLIINEIFPPSDNNRKEVNLVAAAEAPQLIPLQHSRFIRNDRVLICDINKVDGVFTMVSSEKFYHATVTAAGTVLFDGDEFFDVRYDDPQPRGVIKPGYQPESAIPLAFIKDPPDDFSWHMLVLFSSIFNFISDLNYSLFSSYKYDILRTISLFLLLAPVISFVILDPMAFFSLQITQWMHRFGVKIVRAVNSWTAISSNPVAASWSVLSVPVVTLSDSSVFYFSKSLCLPMLFLFHALHVLIQIPVGILGCVLMVLGGFLELCISMVYWISVFIGSSISCIIPNDYVGHYLPEEITKEFDVGEVISIDGTRASVHWHKANLDTVCECDSLQLLENKTVWGIKSTTMILQGSTVIKTKIAIFRELVSFGVLREIVSNLSLKSPATRQLIYFTISERVKAVYFGLVISYNRLDSPNKLVVVLMSKLQFYVIFVATGVAYVVLAMLGLLVYIFYQTALAGFAFILYPVILLLNILMTALIIMTAMFCAGVVASLFAVIMIFAIHLKLFGFPFIGPIVFNVLTRQQIEEQSAQTRNNNNPIKNENWLPEKMLKLSQASESKVSSTAAVKCLNRAYFSELLLETIPQLTLACINEAMLDGVRSFTFWFLVATTVAIFIINAWPYSYYLFCNQRFASDNWKKRSCHGVGSILKEIQHRVNNTPNYNLVNMVVPTLNSPVLDLYMYGSLLLLVFSSFFLLFGVEVIYMHQLDPAGGVFFISLGCVLTCVAIYSGLEAVQCVPASARKVLMYTGPVFVLAALLVPAITIGVKENSPPPSASPTFLPTISQSPTFYPTFYPTAKPTLYPTTIPTLYPTTIPTPYPHFSNF